MSKLDDDEKRAITRRSAVLYSAAALPGLLFACKSSDSRGAPVASAQPITPREAQPATQTRTNAGTYGSAEAQPAASKCGETEASIEGPYYRANAPARVDLTDPGMPGVALEIKGRVTSSIDCSSATSGLGEVELDFWQANHTGHYDNDGTTPPNQIFLRGRVKTDANGVYRVKTIVPGRYLNGKQYRPAHVHVKVRAKGHSVLTTQLYFPDDPYNDIDPFLHKSLIMNVTRNDRVLLAAYDFVLKAT